MIYAADRVFVILWFTRFFSDNMHLRITLTLSGAFCGFSWTEMFLSTQVTKFIGNIDREVTGLGDCRGSPLC